MFGWQSPGSLSHQSIVSITDFFSASHAHSRQSHQSIVDLRYPGSIIVPDTEPCCLDQVVAQVGRQPATDRSDPSIVSFFAFFFTSRLHSRESHQSIVSVTVFSSTGTIT